MLWWLVIIMLDPNGMAVVHTLRQTPFTDLATCQEMLKRQAVPTDGALACMSHDDYIKVKEHHEVKR